VCFRAVADACPPKAARGALTIFQSPSREFRHVRVVCTPRHREGLSVNFATTLLTSVGNGASFTHKPGQPSLLVKSAVHLTCRQGDKILQIKLGSWPNGMKLSANTLPYQGVACLSAGSGSPQARVGQRVTAWDSIYFDRAARRLAQGRTPLTNDKKRAFD
jgi:hypothetical protein